MAQETHQKVLLLNHVHCHVKSNAPKILRLLDQLSTYGVYLRPEFVHFVEKLELKRASGDT